MFFAVGKQTYNSKSVIKAVKVYAARGVLKNAQKSSTKNRASDINSIIDMGWYDLWLSQQLKNIPYAVKELRVEGDSLLTKSSLDKTFGMIENFARTIEGKSYGKQRLPPARLIRCPH